MEIKPSIVFLLASCARDQNHKPSDATVSLHRRMQISIDPSSQCMGSPHSGVTSNPDPEIPGE